MPTLLTKSSFMLYTQSPLELWLKAIRPDLLPPTSHATITAFRQAFKNLSEENEWIRNSDYTEATAYELKSEKWHDFR